MTEPVPGEPVFVQAGLASASTAAGPETEEPVPEEQEQS